MGSIETNTAAILEELARHRGEDGTDAELTGKEITDSTRLPPGDVNDAVTILVESGMAEWLQWMGTSPYVFGQVSITPRGRYELERAQARATNVTPTEQVATARLPPMPVGSPYGFTDHDWESVAEAKSRATRLIVVIGYQFKSDNYDTERLKANVKAMFEKAVSLYNAKPGTLALELDFRPLAAGYGEHLFNEIARDIISADIAVFETSDLNPNVMVEMGVALTWGLRVLPIKKRECKKPPSDISGQTWADYQDSAGSFDDPEHDVKLVRMIERALRKKA